MKKQILILMIFFTAPHFSYAQNTYLVGNNKLIDSLKKNYLSPCLVYKISYKKEHRLLKRDKKLISLLNKLYSLNLSNDFDAVLKNQGFKETVPETKTDYKGRIIYKYFLQYKGNIKAFVQIALSNGRLDYQRILLATDSKFYCTLPNNSYNIYYVDFMYLQKLIDEVHFPLSVAASNTELQSEIIF